MKYICYLTIVAEHHPSQWNRNVSVRPEGSTSNRVRRRTMMWIEIDPHLKCCFGVCDRISDNLIVDVHIVGLSMLDTSVSNDTKAITPGIANLRHARPSLPHLQQFVIYFSAISQPNHMCVDFLEQQYSTWIVPTKYLPTCTSQKGLHCAITFKKAIDGASEETIEM